MVSHAEPTVGFLSMTARSAFLLMANHGIQGLFNMKAFPDSQVPQRFSLSHRVVGLLA